MKIEKLNTFLSNKNDFYNIIPKSIKDISILFKKNGKDLYLVGGAVRDFLNNENPKDFDLCTNATPDEILNIIGYKYKTTEQGKSFGVIVIYTKDQPMGVEVATFREDIYDGKLGITRNPEIKFSTIEGDVLRRDITYNSMFYDLEKRKIIDLVGGIEDIKNKITRFVGNPDDRISEDPLRIMRAMRFSSRYNFVIDLNTEKSIIKNKNKLSIISQERIIEEMKKAWGQVKDYNHYLSFFTKFDMWDQVFPGVQINTKLISSKDLVVVFSNLFLGNDTDKLETKLVQEFKIEGDVAKKIVFLLDFIKMSVDDVFDVYKKKVSSGISDSTILEWLSNGNETPMLIKFVHYKPSVSAEELMGKGITGRDLGIKIKELEIEKFKEML